MKASDIENLKTEGSSGFADLCKLASELGYHDDWGQLQLSNGTYVSDLILFLEDNSGAIAAIYEFVESHAACYDHLEAEDETEDEDGGDE